MKTQELLGLLKQDGIQLQEHGRKHDKCHSPTTGKTFAVPLKSPLTHETIRKRRRALDKYPFF
jgi:hypothetical protein